MKTVIWHGEGRTVFYVADESAPDDEQPCVIASFYSREEAEMQGEAR
ncbi:MAG: hypothetical protein QME77_07070 [bacterium]|nr:hypothetical protein [bacterium]